jgi:hypothetical protein
VPSDKGASRDFESALERDFATLMEFDSSVLSNQEQPLRLPFVSHGRRVNGTPDFLVTFTPESGRVPELVDVKYRDEIFKNWETLKPRFRAARGYAFLQGWTYRIFSEVEIRTPFLINARFLLRFRQQHEPRPEYCEYITAFLAERKQSTATLLLQSYSSDKWAQAILLPDLWRLVAIGEVAAQLDEPLTMDSTIALRERNDDV